MERLLDLWAKSIVLKQEIYVDDSLYKEGYKDASENQKEVLDGIFGKSKEINLRNGVIGYSLFNEDQGQHRTMIGVRWSQEYENKAFVLSCDFDWEIKKDSKNVLCLIPTNK